MVRMTIKEKKTYHWYLNILSAQKLEDHGWSDDCYRVSPDVWYMITYNSF